MTSSDVPGSQEREYLRTRAREYRAMAETASNHKTAEGLLRLADRYEALAARMEQSGSC